MKKLLSIILVVLLCFGVLPTSSFAANEDIIVSAKGGTAQRGGTIRVPISLDANKGFVTLGLAVDYDSNVLEIVCPNHEDGKSCTAKRAPKVEKKVDFQVALDYDCANAGNNSQYHTVDPYLIQWAYNFDYYGVRKEICETGEIAAITFKVRDDAPLGDTKVDVIVDQASGYDRATRTFAGGEAIITICDHIYDNTCDAVCNLCGGTRSINHTYDNDCDAECNVCSFTRVPKDHIYDNACDAICNICGYERIPDEHKVETGYSFENSILYPFIYSNGVYSSTNNGNSYSTTATLTVLKDSPITIAYYTSTEKYYDELIVKHNSKSLVIASGINSWESITINAFKGDKIYLEHSKSLSSNSNYTVYFKIIPSDTLISADDVEPTCKDSVICNECGIVVKPALGHFYSNDCDAVCNVCGDFREAYHVYDNSYDTECNKCGFVRSAPKLAYKYSGTIALVPTDGYEYSCDGITWQSSNIFDNLTENTTYYFYHRQAGSGEETDLTLAVVLKASQLPPDAPIVLGYSDTVIQLLPQSNMEYSLDGIIWQKSNIFAKLSPATEYSFYQRLAENDFSEASAASDSITFTTAKVEQVLIPDAPTVLEVTSSRVILTPVDGCEYSIDGITWQSGNVFDNLSYSTEYTFYQRYAETDMYQAGATSKGKTVKTLKGVAPRPYNAPTLESKTHNYVVLNSVDGYEYSMDGVNWQSSNVFIGLLPKMNYTFYQRVAENDVYHASSASPALEVKTNAKPQYTLGDINGDTKINLKDLVTIAQYAAGWENVEFNDLALDVNGDYTVDLQDVNHLARYLAGWEDAVIY